MLLIATTHLKYVDKLEDKIKDAIIPLIITNEYRYYKS